MKTPKQGLCIAISLLAVLTSSQILFAQPDLGTECTTNTGVWASWQSTSSIDFTNRPGFAHLVVPPQALGGLTLAGGIPVTTYPVPWHIEIAIERPTDVNTAIGFLFPVEGLQALFDSLIQPLPAPPSDAVTGFGSAAGFGSNGKSFSAGPDFSGAPSGQMSGKRLVMYIGMVDNSTMRCGVRPDEGAPWYFAPDFNIGFDASASPVSFVNLVLMIENRDGWMNYVGGLQGEPGAASPPGGCAVDVDYIRFTNNLIASPITAPPQGSQSMVARYQFETNLFDTSGHALNGNADGTINFQPGEYGQEASFSDDAGMTVPHNSLLDSGTHAFTAALWLEVDSTSAAQNVLTITNGNSDGLIIQTVPGGSASLALLNGAGVTVGGPFSNLFPGGELHNVVVAYNPNNSPSGKLYVDGSLNTTFSANLSITNNGDMQIGYAASRPGSGSRLEIDDLRLYNYELSSADIGRFIPAPPQRSTECTTDTGSWVTYNGASSSLTVTPGYDIVTVAQQNFGGLDLPIGIPVNKFPPPWHFEVAFNRPTNINTAVGVQFDQGIEGLFHQVVTGGSSVGFKSVGFDGGKGTANTPDFSGIDPTNMAGSRLVLYVGQVDDTHMRWGVRPNESSAWSFAPDFDMGFSASNSPVSWPDVKLMIETRDGWFNFAAGAAGPTNNTSIAFDYVRFTNNLTPGPVQAADLGYNVAISGNTGLWAAWNGATVNFTNKPGFADITTPVQNFSGMQLATGVPVNSYNPPWHFEIAIDRPTNVNTAVGILFAQGLQVLFNSLSNGSVAFAQSAAFNGSGKGVPSAPDFSGVPASAMKGSRLLLYVGQVDDTHMRWGVRSDESSPWSFAPDIALGFSAAAAPVSWPDMKLMVENRNGWFAQYGLLGSPSPVDIYSDYVKFFPTTLSPTPVVPNTLFTGNSGAWSAWNGDSLDLSSVPAFGTLTTPPAAFGGLQLPGALLVTQYPPPWHLEVALTRPTDVNTAIGFLLGHGIEGLFNSISNGTINTFASATFNGSGKGVPAPPDFSAVPASKMQGSRLVMYLGQVDDTHMRWGVRPNESSAWSFAPDEPLNFSASASPVSWPDIQLMIENRDGWFGQFGAGITANAGPTTVYVDYIKFLPNLTPSYVQLSSRSTECTTDTGSWSLYGGATDEFTNYPGSADLITPIQTFSGVDLTGGIPVDQFVPPWHLEIAFERPTNVNTAIGLLMAPDGTQVLFNSLTNGTVSFQAALFAGAKGVPAGPDFSGVPAAAMTGPRLNLYFGMEDDRTMRWGIRTNESQPWSFAPDFDLGYSASATPVSWSDIKLMIENRDGWFAQYGPFGGSTTPVHVLLDYVRFLPYDVSPTNNIGALKATREETGGRLIVSWPKVGNTGDRLVTLQTAGNLRGPWTTATNQANPRIETPTNSTIFYRLFQSSVPNN
jgi:hypothetical protein